MTHHTERPCAAAGLTSYRYGHIMIGAATVDRLEIWNALSGLYEKVTV